MPLPPPHSLRLLRTRPCARRSWPRCTPCHPCLTARARQTGKPSKGHTVHSASVVLFLFFFARFVYLHVHGPVRLHACNGVRSLPARFCERGARTGRRAAHAAWLVARGRFRGGTVEDGVSCAYPFWGEASTAPDDSAETNHRPLALCTSFCRPPLARVAVLSRLLVLVFFGKSQRQRRGIQFRSARRSTRIQRAKMRTRQNPDAKWRVLGSASAGAADKLASVLSLRLMHCWFSLSRRRFGAPPFPINRGAAHKGRVNQAEGRPARLGPRQEVWS